MPVITQGEVVKSKPGPLSAQRYARVAGALLFITIVAGGFGEVYVPSTLIVSRDAAATAHHILTSMPLFRLGFAGYLVEAVCDIALTLVLYVLLRPVNRNIALLAAFFRIVSTATFATAEFFFMAAPLILRSTSYSRTFSPAQLDALAFLSLKVFGYGGDAFMVFYGAGCTILGYLMFQSGYFPKTLGALFGLGGIGFVVNSFATVLAPAFASPFLSLPMALAVLALAPWLLVKGIDVTKWERTDAI